MSGTKAVYAASLDPITNGHLWVINRGIELFDEFVVSVAINPAKTGRYFFSEKERMSLAGQCIPENVPVIAIGPMYLVDFAQQEK